ncbi:MAG: ATP-binding protein [Pseudomonadota bacterium]|nr:ATP-binding protein [Pseudomonadota bacterium]
MTQPFIQLDDSKSGAPSAVDFGMLFDVMPAPYLVLSLQLTIVAANAAYLQLVRRSFANLGGRSIFDAFPDNPDDPHADGVARLRQSLARVLATGQADKMAVQKYDVADVDGGELFQPRYWKPVNIPVRDSAGEVCHILHTIEEVTAAHLRKQRGLRDVLVELTEAIRDMTSADTIGFAAAAILGRALHTSRVGYGTIDHVSETLHVVRDWCAEGVDTLAGVTALRDYGDFIDDMKLDRFIVINNVDDDPRTAPAGAALRARSAAAFVNAPVVEHGELAAVLFINNAHPREWASDELILIREVAARIRTASERLRSAAALRESEAKFRIIADAMPQMVWSTLPDGYHDYYNQQWYSYTGVPPNSTDGDGWNGLFHPDDSERSWTLWRASLATGKPYEIQYRLRHHSGVYRWVLGRALPVRNDAGAIIRWMGTCTDIDDQKRAEDALREGSARKDEFLAMLAHELRNPLAPISSAAQLLMMPNADLARIQKAGTIISRQVRHLTELVDDLLDVSRVTRGLVQIVRQELDLQDVMHSALEQARPLMEARQHQLTVATGAAPLRISGDRTRLVQVLVNLLNNAAKYTPQGGHITLSLEAVGLEACITVTDNGSGIAPSLLPYVFDLFIQAERTPDRTQGGLGLGLALVKRITALHQGSVHALSEGLGQGSSFMILLPLLVAADTDSAAPMLKPVAALLSAPAGALSIMIVDDHLDGVQTLAELLAAHGHQVLMAEDGARALRLAAGQAIDAFILDIGLPDMDGHALARHLRGMPEGRNALMIALTGYGQAQDRALSKEVGFDHHFVKPADSVALAAVLAQQARR